MQLKTKHTHRYTVWIHNELNHEWKYDFLWCHKNSTNSTANANVWSACHFALTAADSSHRTSAICLGKKEKWKKPQSGTLTLCKDTIRTDGCGKTEFRRATSDYLKQGTHVHRSARPHKLFHKYAQNRAIHTGINSERKSSRLCQYEEKWDWRPK